MKHVFRVAAVCTAALVGAGLTGCGSSGGGGGSEAGGMKGGASPLSSCLAPKTPVALAIGARSNSPQPVLTNSVKDALNNAINANQQVTIIRLDGNPKIVYSRAFNPTGANTQSRKADYNSYINNLNTILDGTQEASTDVRAQIAQANVLEALDIAANQVQSNSNVIVMDSGLQTTPPLDFSSGLLADDPQTITSYLKNANELPDLRGRHVEFVGLAWTAPPQPSLSIADQKKVVQIWNDIATAGGASCVWDDTTADTQSSVPNRPAVAIVTPPPPPAVPVKCSVTDLDDANNVDFDFDSTTFRDPAGARSTLRQLANVILQAGESVTLTGSTSSEGTDSHNQTLSLQRAQAVRQQLVQMGVPADRITTFGDGSHLPGRLDDKGPSGQLLIGPAIQNRKVVAKLTGGGCPR